MSEQKQREHEFVDNRCIKCGQTPPEDGIFYTTFDRMYGRSISCPTPEQEAELKVYYDAISKSHKQLGDDWTEKTLLAHILADVNKALEARWASQGFTRKVTVTIPAKAMEMLKNRKAFTPTFAKDHPIAKMTCWDYIRQNNLMAAHGDDGWEILPRYSFKDVAGTMPKQEIPETLTVQGECKGIGTLTVTLTNPEDIKKVMGIGGDLSVGYGRYDPLTATGKDLDRLASLVKLPAVERADGETDESLRKRALAAHRANFSPVFVEPRGWQTKTFSQSNGGSDQLYICPICGACCIRDSAMKHAEWHEDINDHIGMATGEKE